MVVDVCFVRMIWFVLKSSFQSLNALFVLLKRVVGQAQAIQYLWVLLIDLVSSCQIVNRLREHLQVIVALSTIHQEVCVLLVLIDSHMEEAEGLIVVS